LVIVVGTELSDADLYNGGKALQFGGNVIRIDIDEDQLSRRTTPTVGLVGDAGETLSALTAAIHTKTSNSGREQAKLWREHARAKTGARFIPWLEAIEQTMPSDVIVALDSTQLAYSAHWWLPATQSRSWLAPYGLGTLGCALPMAIGAAVAAPDRPILAIVGDGGWLFTLSEMAVANDLQQRITLLLWDNTGYAQIRESFDDVDATRMGVDISSHDPTAIARGFGWEATEVTTPPQLEEALSAAFASNAPRFIRVLL
jgi:acetolactate synthase-1/2/3 large subunit